MNCINKIDPEWVPSAYQTISIDGPRNTNVYTKQPSISVKALVRHTHNFQKKKKVNNL